MHRQLRTAPIHDFPFRQHSGRLPAQTASPFTGRTVHRHPAKSDGFGFPLSGVTVFQLPRFFIPCRQRAPHGSMQDRQSKRPRRAAPRGHGGGKSRSGRERAGRRTRGNSNLRQPKSKGNPPAKAPDPTKRSRRTRKGNMRTTARLKRSNDKRRARQSGNPPHNPRSRP